MSDDSLTERRRGRPRVEETKERLSLRLPSGEYDTLVKWANKNEQSMSSLARDILSISLRRAMKK